MQEKKGVCAEDSIIAMTKNIQQQHIRNIPVGLATFDSSDAYNAQYRLIIYDKCYYHAGFNEKAMIMLKSIICSRKPKCIVNGQHSGVIETFCGPYQGVPPAATIWCVYFNPLMMHIEKHNKIKDKQNNIIAEIIQYGYMDDITIISSIKLQYKTANLTKPTQYQIPKKVQSDIMNIMQYTINTITEYLSINNIPQNENKTHIMTMNEATTTSTAPKILHTPNMNITKYINPRIKNNIDETIQANDPYSTIRAKQYTINNKPHCKEQTVTI